MDVLNCPTRKLKYILSNLGNTFLSLPTFTNWHQVHTTLSRGYMHVCTCSWKNGNLYMVVKGWSVEGWLTTLPRLGVPVLTKKQTHSSDGITHFKCSFVKTCMRASIVISVSHIQEYKWGLWPRATNPTSTTIKIKSAASVYLSLIITFSISSICSPLK